MGFAQNVRLRKDFDSTDTQNPILVTENDVKQISYQKGELR